MNLAFKKIDITPIMPVQLSGYSTLQVAYSAHDNLYARVFLFENEKKEETLIVQIDLAIIDQFIVNLISQKTSIPKDHLAVCCTHTHSGPGGTIDTYTGILKGLDADIGGALNPEYCNRIANLIGDAVIELRTNLKPASLRIYKGQLEGVCLNRHAEDMECDKDCFVLELTAGNKKALLYRFSGHATVLHDENLFVSADWPGYCEKEFLNEYDMVAFINGCCGDMSPRFTRKECSYEECERIGKLAASQIKDILKQDVKSYTGKDFTFEYKANEFNVPSKKVGTKEEALAELEEAKQNLEDAKKRGVTGTELRLLESVVEGKYNASLSVEAFSGATEVNVKVSALKLPELTFVFTPVEMYSVLANKIKKYNYHVVSITNDFKGYMPDESAYSQGFYEVFSTPYAQGSGELLMKYIVEWLGK